MIEILLHLLFVLSFMPFAGLIITILIEWGIYSLFIRKNFFRLLGYSALINGLTNPLANVLISSIRIPTYFFVIEIFVFIIEVFLIKWLLRLNYKKAILVSFVANLITAFGSLIFF